MILFFSGNISSFIFGSFYGWLVISIQRATYTHTFMASSDDDSSLDMNYDAEETGRERKHRRKRERKAEQIQRRKMNQITHKKIEDRQKKRHKRIINIVHKWTISFENAENILQAIQDGLESFEEILKRYSIAHNSAWDINANALNVRWEDQYDHTCDNTCTHGYQPMAVFSGYVLSNGDWLEDGDVTVTVEDVGWVPSAGDNDGYTPRLKRKIDMIGECYRCKEKSKWTCKFCGNSFCKVNHHEYCYK